MAAVHGNKHGRDAQRRIIHNDYPMQRDHGAGHRPEADCGPVLARAGTLRANSVFPFLHKAGCFCFLSGWVAPIPMAGLDLNSG